MSPKKELLKFATSGLHPDKSILHNVYSSNTMAPSITEHDQSKHTLILSLYSNKDTSISNTQSKSFREIFKGSLGCVLSKAYQKVKHKNLAIIIRFNH